MELSKGRRRRRTQAEVRALIAASARREFAEHGMAGATTRAIAERAGASEVLIYRYFGSKAALFAESILAPFDRLIGEFLDSHAGDLPDRLSGNTRFVRSFHPFLKANADLLQALARSPAEGDAGSGFRGLDDYFARAADRLRLQYARAGVVAEVAPEFGVRFGFGMLAAAILLEEWFFPHGRPDDAAATEALSVMLYKALGPAPSPAGSPEASLPDRRI